MPEDETSTAEAQAEVEERIEESEAEWRLTQAEFQALMERQSRIEESLTALNSRLAQPESPPATAVAVAEASPEPEAEPLTVSEPPAEPAKPGRKSRKRSLKWRKRKAS